MARPELTQAVPGEKNTAKAYNDNNDLILDYIDTSITSTNQTLETRFSGVQTQITNLNNLVNSTKTELEGDIANVYTAMGSNGLYVTTSFNSSTGEWYREFFSDEDKTTRVWLECGGEYVTDSTTNRAAITNYKIVTPKSFSNSHFCFNRSLQVKALAFSVIYLGYKSKNFDFLPDREAEGRLSYVVIDIPPFSYCGGFTWYACGV